MTADPPPPLSPPQAELTAAYEALQSHQQSAETATGQYEAAAAQCEQLQAQVGELRQQLEAAALERDALEGRVSDLESGSVSQQVKAGPWVLARPPAGQCLAERHQLWCPSRCYSNSTAEGFHATLLSSKHCFSMSNDIKQFFLSQYINWCPASGPVSAAFSPHVSWFAEASIPSCPLQVQMYSAELKKLKGQMDKERHELQLEVQDTSRQAARLQEELDYYKARCGEGVEGPEELQQQLSSAQQEGEEARRELAAVREAWEASVQEGAAAKQVGGVRPWPGCG